MSVDPILEEGTLLEPPEVEYDTSAEHERLVRIFNPTKKIEREESSSSSSLSEDSYSVGSDESDTLDSSSSSSEQEQAEVESDDAFAARVERIKSALVDREKKELFYDDPVKLAQQQFFYLVKSIVYRFYWQDDDEQLEKGDSDQVLERKLMGQSFAVHAAMFKRFVNNLAWTVVVMMRGLLLEQVDDDLEHPAVKALDQIMHWREIHVKRKQKRAPGGGDYFDGWMLEKHQHTREVDVAYNEKTGRPILDSKGKLVFVGAAEDLGPQGDDPLRLKELHFFPKPSDRDPSVLDPKADNSMHYVKWCVHEFQGTIPDDLLVPEPFYVSLPQYAVQQFQMLNNILHFTEYCVTKVCKYLEENKVNLDEDTFTSVWSQLVGEKKANSSIFAIGVTSSKKQSLLTLTAEFRNVLRANMAYLTCMGCDKFDLVPTQIETCKQCPKDDPFTLYYCADEDQCLQRARLKHGKKKKHPLPKQKKKKKASQVKRPRSPQLKQKRKPLKKKSK